jgi:stage II sporulation protein AA (anti-sigma F factor antagonist)
VALGKPQVSAQLDGVGPFGHLMVVMERRSDAVVLTLHGRLDIASERCFELALGRARAEGCRRLVIDLSALEFIDYRGLQALLRARRDSLASGHGLSLLRGPAAVQRLFEVTGLVRMFSFED